MKSFNSSTIFRTVFLLALAYIPSSLWGASCCAGASVLPAFLSGQDRLQLGVATSFSEIATDVRRNGQRASRSPDLREQRAWVQVDAAMALSDRWQAGMTVPVVLRTRGDGREAGMGDLSAMLTWEALPDWDYSPWRPAIYLFAQGGLPLHGSTAGGGTSAPLDVFGERQPSLGAGVFLLKTQLTWDSWLVGSARQPLPRSESSPIGDFRVQEGRSMVVSGGFGWSPAAGPLRLGISAAWDHQLDGSTTSSIGAAVLGRTVANLTFEASYLWEEDLRVGVRYFDQGLLGLSRNAPLAQGISVGVQKRWER